MTGPLQGLKVVEMAGQGPVPFAGMQLADLGAEVLRLERPTGRTVKLAPPRFDVVARGRRSVAIDMKAEGAAELVLGLLEEADVFLEGFRPGVCERLGIGPEPALRANPRLVYARVTGWGQDGPRALQGGHDINYIAVTGALAAIGEKGRAPVPPLNLVGDFGGGGMSALVGILAALYGVEHGLPGQVVDVAMVEGVNTLLATAHGYQGAGVLVDERESNFVDGGAPYYRAYECADGNHVAVGAVEPQFFRALVTTLGVDIDPAGQMDRSRWPEMRKQLADAFATRSRDAWVELFDGVDACVSPVLTLGEAHTDPQLVAREALQVVDGVPQPAPSPRFSRTPAEVGAPPRRPGSDTRTALADWGVAAERVEELLGAGVVHEPEPQGDVGAAGSR
ncbi:CaiB/BaiF CoA transferase family protein [Nocardioides caldifontis]|uniref:CaiB/BaiF CoA transferase family protein n=1 Tax=Nocardioides caldifontis TaxID=2588938 RepID=UPI0011E02916|nr:CaiB/BaiF CoA-transferase family protein [Nocardioides caldifontis]